MTNTDKYVVVYEISWYRRATSPMSMAVAVALRNRLISELGAHAVELVRFADVDTLEPPVRPSTLTSYRADDRVEVFVSDKWVLGVVEYVSAQVNKLTVMVRLARSGDAVRVLSPGNIRPMEVRTNG